jgi:hypothetical protein
MAVLPKKKLGCLRCFAKAGAIPLALVAVFALLAVLLYWNFLHRPRLRISAKTTYITKPLTVDGRRVDYVAGWEEEFCPPEMKTDDNGYRMIVRALGDVPNRRMPDWLESEKPVDAKACTAQVYEKLGLDPAIEPTMACIDTYEFLREYSASEGFDKKHTDELNAKVRQPWTLDSLPMMESWLQQNGPVLDLVGQAVRRPAFCLPLVRPYREATLVETVSWAWGDISRMRSLARMIQTRANYWIGMGDIDKAIDDVITCELLGRHAERQGTMVASLVGIAIEGLAASLGVAANRQSQPTDEQLRRFVHQLDALPLRPNIERMWMAERFYTLDSLQATAHGDESVNKLLIAWEDIEGFDPGINTRLPVDWNIVMRRVNGYYDRWHEAERPYTPQWPPVGNLLLGMRSRRVADSLALLHMPAMQAFREAKRRSTCVANLHRITLAMLLYQCEHGTLPPGHTVDTEGNPLHSWRVLLLPYIGEAELYGKLRLDEPWDGEHNRPFHDAAPAIYQCPSATLRPGRTTYSVVVGQNTAFGAGHGRSLDDFGVNLILVVERELSLHSDGQRQGVCWMDPTSELAESIACLGINRREKDGIGSPHPGGLNVGLRDGGVRFIPETIELPSLRGLLDGTAEEFPH